MLCMVVLTTQAIPVKPGQWTTLTLADGTTVRAELYGDEHGTWFRDVQGRCYTRQGDSFVETAGETIAARRASLREARRGQGRRIIYPSTNSGLGFKGRNSGGTMYSVGEYDIPVLMVEFSDTKFRQETTTALIQDYLTKEGFNNNNPHTQQTVGKGCIRDYFVAQSKGAFKPNFKLLGKPYDEDDCAVFYINNDIEDTEYFILESRYPSTWYPEAQRSSETLPTAII